MKRNLDYSGRQFGKLTALSKEEGQGMWSFQCECGKKVIRKIYYVKDGRCKSCGCLRKQVISQLKSNELTGRRIGRLVVIKSLGVDKHGHIRWECQCDCGNKTITTTLNGKKRTKSCGCLQKEDASARMKLKKQNNPYSKTPEYRAALRKRLRDNPSYYLHEKISRMLCHALKGVDVKKGGRTFDMLGYTPAELVSHIEKQFEKGMTWENRNLWQIDHIIPISTAKTEEDVIALNKLSNLRPMWSKENNQKNNKRTHLL